MFKKFFSAFQSKLQNKKNNFAFISFLIIMVTVVIWFLFGSTVCYLNALDLSSVNYLNLDKVKIFEVNAAADNYYVSVDGSDSNSGTEANPFRTVQKAINSSVSGDTIYINSGTYELSGFSKTINKSISLIGEDKNTTVLNNIGKLTFTRGFMVRNLKFTNYQDTIFNLSAGSGDTISGIYIEDCIFGKVSLSGKKPIVLGRYSLSSDATLTDVHISNCDFLGVTVNDEVLGIYLYEGIKNNIYITNNNFYDFVSTNDYKGGSAIYIGSNGSRDVTDHIYIKDNYIEHIVGGNKSSDGNNYPETHGILVYGEDIEVIRNTVKDLNSGQDHEAIYLKASNSRVSDNFIKDCGSGSGGSDLSVKGGRENHDNIVSGNKIIGDRPGRATLINGNVLFKNNYIKKTNGFNGADVYYASNGSGTIVRDNYIEIKESKAIVVRETSNASITGNVAISYNGTPIDSNGASTSGNITCTGYDCDGFSVSNDSCQNQGYLCCASCGSTSYSQYDSDCYSGGVCCSECNFDISSDNYCGDSSCNGSETCSTCPSDCGECPTECGNGNCEDGETCSTCPTDCGSCPDTSNLISNLTPTNYQTANLTEGDGYYIDRDYTITNIPTDYQNLLWIKTANDDKTTTGDSHITFTADKDIKVYIAYDQRFTTTPSWLSTWTNENQSIGVTDETNLDLYSKTFSEGEEVTLGGNNSDNPENNSMYAVLLKESLITHTQGDLNQDGQVNSMDWSQMRSHWFTNNTASDLNNDGTVNSLDFSIMNQNWTG